VKPIEKDALDLLVAAGRALERADSTTLSEDEMGRLREYRFVRRRINMPKCRELLQRRGFIGSLFIPEEGKFEYFLTGEGERFYEGLKDRSQYRI
jgi:hypothetical protein